MNLLKRRPYRNKKILKSAKGQDCTMGSEWCTGINEETVACHSNESSDGKGMAQKADDIFIFFGCSGCHRWYDEGPAPRDEKREAFHRAHKQTLRALLDDGIIK